MFQVLNWNINFPTVYDFTRHYAQLAFGDEEHFMMKVRNLTLCVVIPTFLCVVDRRAIFIRVRPVWRDIHWRFAAPGRRGCPVSIHHFIIGLFIRCIKTTCLHFLCSAAFESGPSQSGRLTLPARRGTPPLTWRTLLGSSFIPFCTIWQSRLRNSDLNLTMHIFVLIF